MRLCCGRAASEPLLPAAHEPRLQWQRRAGREGLLCLGKAAERAPKASDANRVHPLGKGWLGKLRLTGVSSGSSGHLSRSSALLQGQRSGATLSPSFDPIISASAAKTHDLLAGYSSIFSLQCPQVTGLYLLYPPQALPSLLNSFNPSSGIRCRRKGGGICHAPAQLCSQTSASSTPLPCAAPFTLMLLNTQLKHL